MLGARTQTVFVVAATALLFAQAHARADYLSETVPLISQQFGVTAGAVIGEANNGTTAVNGLLPGQVRLTFTADPLSVYTQNGPGLGFTGLQFSTDLSLPCPPRFLRVGWRRRHPTRRRPPAAPLYPRFGVSGVIRQLPAAHRLRSPLADSATRRH